MANPGFDPTDTRARPAEIRRSAEGLQSMSGVLLGHGDDVGSVLSQVALSFSEVIAPAVAAQIGDNLKALETAVEATQYGYAVGASWAQDVETFKAARDELLARWELAEIENFGIAAPRNLWPRPEAAEAERLRLENRVAVADARSLALDGFIREGHALWESFQERVTEKARMFRAGPTPENLALVVSYLGWGAMTLWPEFAPAPVSAADGVAAGTTVIGGLDGVTAPQAVADTLVDVAAIIRRAESGYELTPAEVDFLAAFYETVGRRVTELPDYLAQTSFTYTTSAPTSRTEDDSPPTYTAHTVDGLDPSWVTALTAASANGMLVLSRSGPGGGGYARLPTWVRDSLDDEAAAGPLPVGPDPEDFEDLCLLGGLLDHSTVTAGDGLSRELGLALGRVIPSIHGFEDFSPTGTSTTWGEQVDALGQSFLDVIARNDAVASDLITGSNMPPAYSPRAFLLDVYSFEWSDDGVSAADLTRFIAGNAGSADPAQQAMAAESMLALFDIVTAPGSPGFETLMDRVGNSGAAGSSSLGQVNPEISAGLGSLMASYLGDFGMPEGSADVLGKLTTEDRVRFTTLIVTAPGAAEDLVAAITDHNVEQLSGVTDSITTAEYGMQAGRLLGLVDAAAVNVVMDQLGDELEGAQEEEKPSIIESVVDVTLGRLPGIGGAIGEVLGGIAAGGDAEDIPWPDVGEAISEDTERHYQLLAGVVQDLRSDNRLPSEIDPRLLDGSGGIRDLDELEMNGDVARALLEAAIEQALGLDPGDLLQELDSGYQEVAGQLPSAPEVYENAIEG